MAKKKKFDAGLNNPAPINNLSEAELNEEYSSIKSSFYPEYITMMNGYNPDILVGKKSLSVFDDMMRDEQVKAALLTKIHAILSSSFEFHSPSDKFQKQTDFVRKNLVDDMEGSFNDNLFEMIQSFLQYGVLIAELNYVYKDGAVLLKNIKPRAPHTFKIYDDEFGDIAVDGLRQYQTAGLVPMPLEKFVVYSYRKKFSNFWGSSDLVECYRPWFIKDNLTKMEAIYLEKHAIPSLIAKYENMAAPQRKKLMSVLQSMRSASTVLIPKGVEVEFQNVISNGGMHFRNAINYQNESISKAILMPNQLGFNKTELGSNAKAMTQFDVFMWTIESIRNNIEESIVNEQIIKRLVYYNFGEQEDYPQFKFNPLKEKDKMTLYAQWKDLVANKIVLPTKEDEDFIRKSLEMPERTEESELLEVPADEPVDPNAVDPNDPENSDVPQKPDPEKVDNQEDVKKKNKKFENDDFPITQNMERTDFGKINNILTTHESQLLKDVEIVLQKICTEITDRIEKKKIISDKKFHEIDKLQLKYVGDLRLAFQNIFKAIYKEGKDSWKSENKSKKQMQGNNEILPDEYLAWLKSKAYMEAGKLADAYKTYIKQQMIIGLENGYPENKIVSNIDQGFSLEDIPGSSGKPVYTMGQLGTIVRMNISASFNKARYLQALDLSDSSETPVYGLYSEVMEGHDYKNGKLISHPFSGFIHGKYVLMGTELAQRLQYPLHFNDRGVLITVDSGYADIPEDKILTQMPDLSKYSGLTIDGI